MVREKNKTKNYLTPLEWEVMNGVWKLGGKPAVREVIKTAYPHGEKAYTTIQTVMNNLVIKGFLKKKKIGMVNFYEPKVKQADMFKNAVVAFVKNVFSGSYSALASYLQESGLSATEVKKKAVKKAKKKK